MADLVSRMTVAEKASQLRAVWGYALMENRETFSEKKAADLLNSSIGQITRHGNATTLPPREVAEFANLVQQFLLEKTRLGIPALIHDECLCGYQARGATIFPQAIGLASTWHPELIREMTSAIRRQLITVGARQALAPVLDVAREPRWGRASMSSCLKSSATGCWKIWSRTASFRSECWIRSSSRENLRLRSAVRPTTFGLKEATELLEKNGIWD